MPRLQLKDPSSLPFSPSPHLLLPALSLFSFCFYLFTLPIYPSGYLLIAVTDSVTRPPPQKKHVFFPHPSWNTSLVAHNYVTLGVFGAIEANSKTESVIPLMHSCLNLQTLQNGSFVLSLWHLGLNTAALKKHANMGSNEWRIMCITHPSILNHFIVSSVYIYRSHNTLEAFNKKQVTTAETCSVTLGVCVLCVWERDSLTL